jgi:hypothetical protein
VIAFVCPHPLPLSHCVGEGCRGERWFARAFPLSRRAGEGDTGGEGRHNPPFHHHARRLQCLPKQVCRVARGVFHRVPTDEDLLAAEWKRSVHDDLVAGAGAGCANARVRRAALHRARAVHQFYIICGRLRAQLGGFTGLRRGLGVEANGVPFGAERAHLRLVAVGFVVATPAEAIALGVQPRVIIEQVALHALHTRLAHLLGERLQAAHLQRCVAQPLQNQVAVQHAVRRQGPAHPHARAEAVLRSQPMERRRRDEQFHVRGGDEHTLGVALVERLACLQVAHDHAAVAVAQPLHIQ